MFQYATLYAAAKATNLKMGTDHWEGEDFFSLPRLPRDTSRHKLEEHPSQRYDPRVLRVADGTELVGFFQTDKYFRHLREEILRLFTPNKYIKAALDAECRKFSKPILVVHSREGDFASSNGVFPVISRSFIKAALDLVVRERGLAIDQYDVVLLSDNPSSAALNFLPKFHRSRLSGIVDLFLMTRADVCILSGSSFSWWGAWLNQRDPLVIGPKYWINCRRPSQGWFPADAPVEGWKYLEEEKEKEKQKEKQKETSTPNVVVAALAPMARPVLRLRRRLIVYRRQPSRPGQRKRGFRRR